MASFGGEDDLVEEALNLRSSSTSSAVRDSAMGAGVELEGPAGGASGTGWGVDHVVEELLEKVILWHPLLQ